MPYYRYRHPKTGEIFEAYREQDTGQSKPFVADDNIVCEHVLTYKKTDGKAIWVQAREGKWRYVPAGQEVEKYLNPHNSKKWPKGLVNKGCEVWEKDPDYVRRLNPKKVKLRSGESVPYNPNTMR